MQFDFSLNALTALAQVVVINVALSGDNAIVVGMAAAGLPTQQRNRAIAVGIAAAALLRIVFAVVAVEMLNVIGLMLAGGLLLLWVCWKLWSEIREGAAEREEQAELALEEDPAATIQPDKSFRDSVIQIIIADVSMSLDNVLAVAGAARAYPWVMVVGLVLSVALMGLAAALIARLLHRHHWLAYVGILIIFYVSLKMISDGGFDIFDKALDANLI